MLVARHQSCQSTGAPATKAINVQTSRTLLAGKPTIPVFVHSVGMRA